MSEEDAEDMEITAVENAAPRPTVRRRASPPLPTPRPADLAALPASRPCRRAWAISPSPPAPEPTRACVP